MKVQWQSQYGIAGVQKMARERCQYTAHSGTNGGPCGCFKQGKVIIHIVNPPGQGYLNVTPLSRPTVQHWHWLFVVSGGGGTGSSGPIYGIHHQSDCWALNVISNPTVPDSAHVMQGAAGHCTLPQQETQHSGIEIIYIYICTS